MLLYMLIFYIFPVIYIYKKTYTHTQSVIFCMDCVWPPGCDLSASYNGVLEESAPSQVTSTLPSSPYPTLLISLLCLGSGAAQILGEGRSSSAGCSPGNLCHNMMMTWHQGCLAVWRKHPWALALVEPHCYRRMVQTPQEFPPQDAVHECISSFFVRKMVFSKALMGTCG